MSGWPRWANWEHQFFYWYSFLMIQVSIPSSAAFLTGTISIFVPICVFFGIFMATLAMRFCALHFSVDACANKQSVIRSAVLKLFFSCRPPAIRRFIVSVVVDSVQCSICWAFAHVSKKIKEPSIWFVPSICPPAVADSYSTSTPIMIIRKFFVVASLNHRGPTVVCRPNFWVIPVYARSHMFNYNPVTTGVQ